MLPKRLVLLAGLSLPSFVSAQEPKSDPVAETVEAELPDLKKLYEHLHANPELSSMEVRTSARIADELKKAGFDVTTKVGGTGVVGVLKNGDGPTVLIRTDLDALPVTEATGLPYASTVRTRDKDGKEVGAMHACGHDVHMTCFVGAARTLAAHKDKWAGTLVMIGQPAEETGKGAKAMLDDGLLTKFPKPDLAIALHADAQLPVGQIGYVDGLAMANADSLEILVKGRGGHGAQPHLAIDPVVIAARIVMDLQTIVSRERHPVDPCVVTVGSIHGGTKHNIIPNEVKMQLTVRTTNDATRKKTLDSIERIAKAAAMASDAPEPVVTTNIEFTPALYNDSGLTKKTLPVFKELLGETNVVSRLPTMGAEDFSRYSVGGRPVLMFYLGTVPKDRHEESKKPGAKPLPGMHSDSYAPDGEGSIRIGTKAMSLAVINLMGKK
jgi:hippurate hydrolase